MTVLKNPIIFYGRDVTLSITEPGVNRLLSSASVVSCNSSNWATLMPWEKSVEERSLAGNLAAGNVEQESSKAVVMYVRITLKIMNRTDANRITVQC